jgi:hypothetical protein
LQKTSKSRSKSVLISQFVKSCKRESIDGGSLGVLGMYQFGDNKSQSAEINSILSIFELLHVETSNPKRKNNRNACI